MEQQPKQPIGLSGKPNTFPQITWQQFFQLKHAISQVLDFLINVEQQEMLKGNVKPFYESDVIEKETMDKGGKLVKYHDLKSEFWEEKPLIVVDSSGKTNQ